MMTKAIDPRKGLHRQLNLLDAYKVYEKDYPLYVTDISATLAMDSPLYHRIDSTLTLQSLNTNEFEAYESQLRGAALSAGIPLEQLREAYRVFRESQAPPQPQAYEPPPRLRALQVSLFRQMNRLNSQSPWVDRL